jgi:hypothetical protein
VSEATKKKRKRTRPENQVTKLMKAMGSRTGAFDPEPPDQWKYDLVYGAPDDRYVAWVKSKTIAVGHMTAHATAERGPRGEVGRSLTLKDAREELGWERKFSEKVARETDRQGRTARDSCLHADGSENSQRRIFLRAEVKSVQPIETNGNEAGSGTVYSSSDSPFIRLLPGYVADQLKAWDLERRQHANHLLDIIYHWHNDRMAESAQATRAMTGRVLHGALESLGATFRPEPVKKKGRPDSGRAAQPGLFDWRQVKTASMDFRLTSVPEEIAAILPESLKAPVQAPSEPLQAPPPAVPEVTGTGFLYTEESAVYTEKNVPATLLYSDPDSVGIRESVEIRESVNQSQPDGSIKAAEPAPKAGEKKTPPMKAATVPNPASKTVSAIPDRQQAKTAAKTAAQGRTGLTGTPSIELRKRQHERREQIAAIIPDEIPEELGEEKSLNLLAMIDFALQESPQLPLLRDKIAHEWKFHRERFTSLGLIIKLAEPIGNNWAKGAAKREQEAAAAERARQADEKRRETQLLLDAYSRQNDRAAGEMLRTLSTEDRLERTKEKIAWLKKEGRWPRIAPDVREREVQQLILLDLARELPTFDEWLARRKEKGASL